MKTGIYCSEVSNVQRLLNGVKGLENRGAEEASWMLVHGKNGLGKTRALQWFSVRRDAALVTAKPGWSIPWMLKDICGALDMQPSGTASQMSDRITTECVMRRPLLIIDEIGEIALKGDLIGTLRHLSEVSQLDVIAAGNEKTLHKLKQNADLFSRISEFAQFNNATENDVRILCTKLAEVDIGDDLVAHIHTETGGNFREVMNAIARIERAMKRNKGQTITRDMAANVRYKNYARKTGSANVRAA